MDRNEESPNQKSYGESYFMFKKLISEIFILPLIFYILSISFITHVSIFNQPLKSQVNLNSAKKRKILFLIMIFLYLCRIISIIKVTNLETSQNTISSPFTLIILLFHIMSIMAILLTIYFIDEKNKKQIKIDKRNLLEWFIILNIIYFLLDLVNEIVYGYFSFLTPFTFCYCIYFQIFFYKYPDDNYKIFLSKGFKYIELNEFDKELINKKLENIKINEQKYKNNNNTITYIPMTYVNSNCNMLGNEPNQSDIIDENIYNNINNDNYKENNSKINQLINELYNPNNNTDYLKNSYESVLEIIVTFQSNFCIDYGTYYNYNKTKKNILKNQNKNRNLIKSRLSLLNSHTLIDDDNSEDHFDIANFYTSIIFTFNVSATSSFYITNKHLRKSLEEFFKLDIVLENEFTEERYSKSLVNKLPRLNIKKCFDVLSNNIKKGINISNSSNNSDILLECIQNTKNICEKYLKDITSNPHFIIPEVLFFLEIRDKNVFQLYININNQIRKKDTNNIISRFSRKSENTLTNNFFLSNNCNYFTSHDDYNMKIIIKIIKGDFFENILKNKNNKEPKIYYLLIRLTYGECNKFVRKKFEETIFVLQEFNKLLDYNYYNSTDKKDKNKNNNSKIIQAYSDFLQIYNKLNETSNNPSHSFKLNKYSKIFDHFKQYPEYINKDIDLFDKLIISIESILNIIINYYIDEIPKSNQIIHEYFIDCIDDYWNVDKLKKYLKHDNNLLSLFQNEIKEKTINDIFVLDKNYLYININYNITVFYELCFKITTTSNFIQLDKKYEFEEVKNYIDLMNLELSLGLVWPEKCFLVKEDSTDEINNNIHIIRLSYMSKYLNKIFNSNKIFTIINWIKIFYDDKSYHDVIQIKFKELKYSNNKNNKDSEFNKDNKDKKDKNIYEKEIIRKNSNESSSFYLSNNNIKLNDDSFNLNSNFKNNEENSEEIRSENNLILDDNSMKSNKNNLKINNNSESLNSSESIVSHYSKNSNVKKLFDV